MPDWLILLLIDLEDVAIEVRASELARPSMFALWLLILFMPIIGVDRRDVISGAMYVLYCMAAGAAMVFALPQELAGETSPATPHIVVSCMGAAAALRWVFIGKEALERYDVKEKELDARK